MNYSLSEGEQDLLAVVRRETAGLDDRLPALELSTGRMTKVAKLAREHTVLGIVAHAVCRKVVTVEDRNDDGTPLTEQQKNTKEDLAMYMVHEEMQHMRRHELFGTVLHEFHLLMELHQIPYVVFKGMAVAQHYPTPHARTMGDVDFYVPSFCFAQAVEVIESAWGVTIEKEDVDKHYSFSHKGIKFEMHHRIETFGSKKHQRYFDRMVDENIVAHTARLSATADLLVVFKHWFNHLLVEGVGLRQTLDLAVLLNACQDDVEAAELKIHLEAIGYWHAFRALVALEERYLGLACASHYCTLEKNDYAYADKLMAEVMESGNFGRKAYRNRMVGNRKSMETASRAFRHCWRFWRLAPWDISCLVPKRIMISVKRKG